MSDGSPTHTSEPPDAPGDARTPVPPPEQDASYGPGVLGRLNRHGFRLLMVADTLGLLAVLVISMVVRYRLDWPSYPLRTYLISFTIIVLIFVAALYFGGAYEREPRLAAPPWLPRAARQTLAAGGLVALLNLSLTGIAQELDYGTQRALPMPTVNLVVLIVFGAGLVAGNRALSHWLRTRREGPPRVVMLGDPEEIETARAHLAADPGRLTVTATVAEASGLIEAVRATGATDVAVLSPDWLDDLYPDVISLLERRNISMLLRVGARETVYGLERVREIGGLPFILLRSQTIPVSRARFKRFFDLSAIVVAAPLLLLLTGAIAVYQLLVAGRPLLYTQSRVGVGGRTFPMVKFRTMVVDAESDARGARLAEREDPRVVRGCGWVRATRMDELPQLWNVLRGEMSLVGPRPERPELTTSFASRILGYERRHEIPPGITGLAQIHGRYHTDAEYKLGYDLQYLVNWSPVLDLEILVRTLWVIVTRRL